MTRLLLILSLICICSSGAWAQQVSFHNGHQTDPQDRGRPVALIASALGVPSEVFRQAFSGVTPARGGHPTQQRARDNKRVLMDALAPHGVSNERLDTVSNYYRYRPGSGELWNNRPAQAKAIIRNGMVTQLILTDAGSGYCSPPDVYVEGYGWVPVRAEIGFSHELENNGRITSLTLK